MRPSTGDPAVQLSRSLEGRIDGLTCRDRLRMFEAEIQAAGVKG